MMRNTIKRSIAFLMTFSLIFCVLPFTAGAVSYSEIYYNGTALTGTTLLIDVGSNTTTYDLTSLRFSVPSGVSYSYYSDKSCTVSVDGTVSYNLASNGSRVFVKFTGSSSVLVLTVIFGSGAIAVESVVYATANKTHIFTADDFSLGGIVSTTNIRIDSLPSGGTLFYGTSKVTISQKILLGNISYLKYITNSVGTVNFNFSVVVGTTETSSTMTIIADRYADSPTVSSFIKGVEDPDDDFVFTSSDFTDNYHRGVDAGTLSYITIKTLPDSTDGVLYLSSTAVTAGATVSLSNLGLLTFKSADTFTNTASFTWTASDSDGLTSSNTSTVTMSIANFAPTLTSFTLTTIANNTFKFLSRYFDRNFTDINGDSMSSIEITSIPEAAAGILYYNGTAISSGTQIALAGIPKLTFVPTKDYTGSASFGWKASDGTIFSSTSAVCKINIVSATKVVAGSFSMVSGEDDDVYFSLSDFTEGFTNADNSQLSYIRFTHFSSSGTLYLSGAAVTESTVIKSSEISSLVFKLDDSLTSETTLSYVASSDGTTYSSDAGIITIKPTIYDLTISDSDAVLTFDEQVPDSDYNVTAQLNAQTIASMMEKITFTGGTLTVEVPYTGSSIYGTSLSIDGSMFTNANIAKISAIKISDSNSILELDTASAGKYISSDETLTISLTRATLDDSSALQSAGIARSVSFTAGGNDIDVDAKLYIRYMASTDNQPLSVLMKRISEGTYEPMLTSAYYTINDLAYVGADITGGSAFIVCVNKIAFTDVPDTNWAYPYITSLAAKSIIAGMGNSMFEPHSTLTRAQFIKLLTVALGLENDEAVCSFTDVADTSWYYPYVASAVEAQIITDSGKFNPDDKITRQDACLYAYLAIKATGYSFSISAVTTTFTDESTISDDCLMAVKNMQALGIINGYTDGSFLPLGSFKRSEASKIIYLIMNLLG